jgi:hypothetical protein
MHSCPVLQARSWCLRALSHTIPQNLIFEKILEKKELERRKVETLAKSGSRLKFYLVDADKFSFEHFISVLAQFF